jgi:hypothetical protein
MGDLGLQDCCKVLGPQPPILGALNGVFLGSAPSELGAGGRIGPQMNCGLMRQVPSGLGTSKTNLSESKL